MFIEIDESIDHEIDSGCQAAIDLIDLLCTAHRMGNLILALTRPQAVRYRQLPAISDLSRRTASFISLRLNDYIAAMKAASRVIRACSPTVQNNFSFSGKTCQVSYRILSQSHILTQKFLLGEGFRDVSVLRIIASEYYATVSYPSAYVTFRPLIGGGGSCHHALQAETAIPCKGLAICDRDAVSAVPPFKHNTTAEKVAACTDEMSLMTHVLGVSENSPFFGFDVTWGRTIENMIGPNLLDTYFSAMNRPIERQKFTSAFPQFPQLDPAEIVLWRDLNLKDGTPSLHAQLQILRNEIGPITASLTGRLSAISQIALPSDTLDWIIENQVGSRFSRGVSRALRCDLGIPAYRTGVEKFALPLLTLAAGDSSARRS
ncbi:hypothetical protein [Novosphingobium lindaniclasticum]|uniref:hypothetical protein n=1 Tax=Novosphingobium lindaniclasticum TaxID=1329895 RepID=UPI0012679AD6|nr:hypothetical protein [Novosphingobium lindaniclasticum]